MLPPISASEKACRSFCPLNKWELIIYEETHNPQKRTSENSAPTVWRRRGCTRRPHKLVLSASGGAGAPERPFIIQRCLCVYRMDPSPMERSGHAGLPGELLLRELASRVLHEKKKADVCSLSFWWAFICIKFSFKQKSSSDNFDTNQPEAVQFWLEKQKMVLGPDFVEIDDFELNDLVFFMFCRFVFHCFTFLIV